MLMIGGATIGSVSTVLFGSAFIYSYLPVHINVEVFFINSSTSTILFLFVYDIRQ